MFVVGVKGCEGEFGLYLVGFLVRFYGRGVFCFGFWGISKSWLNGEGEEGVVWWVVEVTAVTL